MCKLKQAAFRRVFSNLVWAERFFFSFSCRMGTRAWRMPAVQRFIPLRRTPSTTLFPRQLLKLPSFKGVKSFWKVHFNNHIITQSAHPYFSRISGGGGLSWVRHLFIWEPYILWRNGAGLWTQSRRRRMSVRRALPVNHALKGYHPNLQGPLPTHQSSPTRPGHRPTSHAHTLVTGDIRKPRRLLSPSPISIPISILSAKSIGITYSKVWLWLCAFQNSVTLPRLCTRLKATVARSVTPAALSRWISALLFIAVMIAGSSYRALLGLSCR